MNSNFVSQAHFPFFSLFLLLFFLFLLLLRLLSSSSFSSSSSSLSLFFFLFFFFSFISYFFFIGNWISLKDLAESRGLKEIASILENSSLLSSKRPGIPRSGSEQPRVET